MRIHIAQKSDYPSIKRLWQYSFGFSQPFLEWSLGNMLSSMRIYTAQEDGEKIAVAASVPMSISDNGKTIRASYLCGCTTSPEYRGKGVMRSLIGNYIEQMAGEGIPISLCVPFDYKTMERYGWRTAYMYKQYKLSVQSVPPYTIKGKIKLFKPAERPIMEISRIYEEFTKRLNGYSKRSFEEWRRILDDLTVNFGGSCAVYYDKSGVPSGYMLYLVHGSEMRVYEMASVNKTASDSMYAFMKNHASQVDSITIKVPQNDTAHLDFCDSRNAVSLCPFVSARITDVYKALSYICDRTQKEVKLQVVDRLVQSNNATFSISANGVVRTDEKPDAVTDVGTLAQLFMGFIDVNEAKYMNLIAGETDALDELFVKQSNYINMLII